MPKWALWGSCIIQLRPKSSSVPTSPVLIQNIHCPPNWFPPKFPRTHCPCGLQAGVLSQKVKQKQKPVTFGLSDKQQIMFYFLIYIFTNNVLVQLCSSPRQYHFLLPKFRINRASRYLELSPPKKNPAVEFSYLFIYFFVFSFRAAPTAYGGSLARSLIRAIAAGLHQSHSYTRSEPRLQPTPQLTATPDP